jgi:rSAM/selenodomain-associated transferase 1
MKGCSVIVFAKAPVPGQVKTRLVKSLGACGASQLSEHLVFHTLGTALGSGVGPVTLWCAPSTEHPFFRRCAERFNVDLRPQSGGDLGQRMADAFGQTLKVARAALLIGTDCPSLTERDLQEASLVLGQKTEAVIVPAEDGGYVLMGLRRFAPSLFEGVPWGTEKVLMETRRRLRNLGWAWHEMTVRWDVDRPEDVKRMIAEGYSALLSPDDPTRRDPYPQCLHAPGHDDRRRK